MPNFVRTPAVFRRARNLPPYLGRGPLLAVLLFTAALLALSSPLAAQRGGADPFNLRHVPPAMRDSVVGLARTYLGTPYLYGGTRPESGFDCSGFTRHVLSAFGIRVPRTAREQALVGREVPRELRALRVGDLLTFGNLNQISHIGIYIGGGRYIHASSYSGRVVEAVLDLSKPRMQRRWRGVRRVIAAGES